MSDKAESRRKGGSYKEKLKNAADAEIEDFYNPWKFFGLFMCSDNEISEWCRNHGLLAKTTTCTTQVRIGTDENGNGIMQDCGGVMTLRDRGDKSGLKWFRCSKDRDHEKDTKGKLSL